MTYEELTNDLAIIYLDTQGDSWEYGIKLREVLKKHFPAPVPFEASKIAERYEGVVQHRDYMILNKAWSIHPNFKPGNLNMGIKISNGRTYYYIPFPETFEQFESDVFRATGVELKRKSAIKFI